MKRLDRRRIARMRAAALRYYARHARDLPWRRTRDPYRILVSEVMLQQTQVERVVPKYHSFLRRFPTPAALAGARMGDVLRAWIGLGYNGRALRLWQAARQIVRQHAGALPREHAALRALPGVGDYTASALRAFAFGAHVAAIDVNVRRVLTRALLGEEIAHPAMVRRLGSAVLPSGRAAAWSQALMDIGSAFCRVRPNCAACPLRRMCLTARKPRGARTAVQPGGKRQTRFAGSNRFYRGRIIAALARTRSVSVPLLGRQVKDGFNLSDRPWLRSLLKTLANEGLVRLQRGGLRASLP